MLIFERFIMRLLVLFMAIIIFGNTLITDAQAQDCTDPDGDVGTLQFNVDYGVLQICTPKNWIALHSRTCPDGDGCVPGPTNCDNIGDECDDGSFYIGDSPAADGAKVYMTSAAYEGSGIRWDNPSCYRCGDGSVAGSTTDGRINVAALRAWVEGNTDDGDLNGFDAARHCEDLNDESVEAHGYADWYLPAGGNSGSELDLLWAMVDAVGTVDGIGSSSDYYWSSFEYTVNSNSAYVQRFSGPGQQGIATKNIPHLVRCVRR